MKEEYLQADGIVLTATFDRDWQFGEWHSQVHVNSPTDGRVLDAQRRRVFHIAPSGNYDWMIASRYSGVKPVVSEFDTGQFEVYASPNPESTQGLLLWRGPYHVCQTYLPKKLAADGRRAVGYLAGIRFEDDPLGLVLKVDTSVGESVVVQEAFMSSPLLATLTFHSPAIGLGFVPTWQGASVPAGEVWRTRETDAGNDEYLVLASPSSVCVVTPAGGNASLMPNCLDLVKSLSSITTRAGGR